MGLDIYAGDIDPVLFSQLEKLLFSSGRRKMDGAFKRSRQMEKLLITRKKCPQLRSRRQWRTGGIKS